MRKRKVASGRLGHKSPSHDDQPSNISKSWVTSLKDMTGKDYETAVSLEPSHGGCQVNGPKVAKFLDR